MNNKTIKSKLDILLEIQNIDIKLDDINKVRGDLPEEVRELEDEMIGFQTQIENFKNEIETVEKNIADKKNGIIKAEAAKKKYEQQQLEVRNNREYEALIKEIELQDLEVKVNKKHIKEHEVEIEQLKIDISETEEQLDVHKQKVQTKQQELIELMEETKVEEAKLAQDREKTVAQADTRLYRSYSRLRNNSRNGLAIVNIRKGACGGCFNMVPPQRQAEIKTYKKILTCEYCGRILKDVLEVEEPTPSRRPSSRN